MTTLNNAGLCLLIILMTSGCPLLIDNELEITEPSVDSGTDAASETAGAAGAGGASCGTKPVSNLQICPEACDRCVTGVCQIDCATKDQCKDRIFQCPTGIACEVRCTAETACEKMTIQCAATYACDVECAGAFACKDAKLNCGSGPCGVRCGAGANACEKFRVACGSERCEAKCAAGAQLPQVDCANSCGCTQCFD